MVCANERVEDGPEGLLSTPYECEFDAAQKGASEVRTVCGSAASTGLCGGWLVTAIPTATGSVHLKQNRERK